MNLARRPLLLKAVGFQGLDTALGGVCAGASDMIDQVEPIFDQAILQTFWHSNKEMSLLTRSLYM